MKIVIDISEKDYRDFVLQNDSGILDEKTPSHRAKIANGQILPKGHGRLIDASQIPYECEGDCMPEDRMCHECDMYCVTLRDVMQVKTIVEADKEGAEE